MNHTQQQLLKLLGSGVSNAVAAQAVGITDAAVSQYLADPAFAAEVARARTDRLQAATKRDERYNEMEDVLLDKLESTLPFMHKPGEILGAIRIINNAQRRGAQAGADSSNQPQKIVVLNMPMQVVQRFTLNASSEVVEVENKTMATLPSDTLLKRMRTPDAASLPPPAIEPAREPVLIENTNNADN